MSIPMFQITLRAARIACGYTQEEAAKHCGISVQELEEYEKDCSDMPVTKAVKIRNLYGFPLDYIFIGPESEAFQHNREISARQEAQRKEAV